MRAIHSCGAVADSEPRFPNISMRYRAELEQLRTWIQPQDLTFQGTRPIPAAADRDPDLRV